jgi:hypothetical protein
MPKVVGAKVSGDLEERYEEAIADLGEEESKSDVVRELLEEAFRGRDEPLFLRLDLPNRVAAQMENDRERGESDEVVTQRFLREAVEAREADVLDHIDADEELRELVERERDPGESLPGAVRRLLRAGCENTQDARLRRLGGTWGMKTATGFILASVVPIVLVLTAPSSIMSIAAAVGLLTAFVMWVLAFIAIAISIVANILLARPFRATLGLGVDGMDTDTGVVE